MGAYQNKRMDRAMDHQGCVQATNFPLETHTTVASYWGCLTQKTHGSTLQLHHLWPIGFVETLPAQM